jgi:hypothetical protein
VSSGAEAWQAPSNACQPGAGPSQDSPGAVAAKALRYTLKREPQRRVVSVSGMAKASRPGVERSMGARIVCRLQKSARSIFLSLSSDGELKGNTDEGEG